MDKVLPVEEPFWFSVAMPADPRQAPVLRDLSVRLARQVGCANENADAFGLTLAEAAARAIERADTGPAGARLEARFRVSPSAFEVTLVLTGTSEGGLATLAALDPAAVWSGAALRGATDGFEVSREPDGIRCRVTRLFPRADR